MAFSYPIAAPGTSAFYNVDFSVGTKGYNRYEDNLLVQALFRIFYYEIGFENCPPPPGDNGIAVDGFFGPATQRHIVQFQQQLIAAGGDVSNDGLLDPFRDPYGLSTVTKKYYALELLNDILASGCLERGVDNFSNLPNRQDVPIALRNALKTVKTTATRYSGMSAADRARKDEAMKAATASATKALSKLFKTRKT